MLNVGQDAQSGIICQYAQRWATMTITPSQSRAARGLIGMDQAALAEASSVSRNTIVSFESGQRTPGANNLAAIRSAL